jgi:hypothetical protein
MQINVSGWGAFALVLLGVFVTFAVAPEAANGMLDSAMEMHPTSEASA